MDLFRGGRFLFCVAALAVAASAAAKDTDPLYLQSPYDEITLDDNNNKAVLKVQPLNLPGHKLPAAADRKGDIEIELLDQAGQKFAVAWGAVAGVRFFEDLVLAEAQQRVSEGRFDEAYDYFRFLEAKYPWATGLKDAVENCLWVQIGASFKAGRFDDALALLAELSSRNPQRMGLNKAYERVTVELVNARMAENNYRAVRLLLRNLGDRYPEAKATTIAPFETMLKEKATALLVQAKADIAAGKLREAHEAASRMLEIWPTIEEGQQLAAEVHVKYPLLTVGVVSPLASAPLKPADDWASLRAGRLLGRPLAERAAGKEGVYLSSLGELSRVKGNAAQLVLKLREGLRWSQPPRNLTAQDVARSLLAAADSQQPTFDPAFAGVLAGVELGNAGEVRIEFLRPQIRPEGWLQRSLWAGGGKADPASHPLGYGPYKLAAVAPQQVSLIRQAEYFGAEQTQPSEIIERTFPDSAAALQALRRGEVNIVDRISPWDLRRISSGQEFTVTTYSLPTVYVLLPNPRRPLTASRTMRRAILYAIDREGILRRGLLTGQAIPGCEVISGPFPRPVSKDDPHGHAYNPQVEVRPYDPAVASVLAGVAAQESGGAAGVSRELLLAHPAEPMSRIACESIARQLELAGLSVKLRELAPGPSAGDSYDLLYAELAMRDPAVDAWRLLGPGGMTGECSSAMLLALRSLEEAADAKQAALRLQEVHRVAAAELPVIPLWQLVHSFAFHKSVQGVSAQPIGLYDDIEHWKVELRIPTE